MNLDRLLRRDKWFLSNGRACLAASPFPRWLATPGYWDEVYFADVRIPRAFTVLFVRDGRPVRATTSPDREWRPDRLVLEHAVGGARIRERRFVHPANAWTSEFQLTDGPGVDLLVWTLLPTQPEGPGTPWQSASLSEPVEEAVGLRWDTRWPEELAPDRTAVEGELLSDARGLGPSVPVFLALGASGRRLDYTISVAQRHDESPLWETSVLPEKLRDGRLANEAKASGEGLLHVVQRYRLEPGQTVRVACGAGLSPADARRALDSAREPDALDATSDDWTTWFESLPGFRCDDPYLEAAYAYRAYGLRLNTVDVPGLPNLGRPFVAEGIGFFRNFITYSSQAMLREVAWCRDPRLAVGILDNLVAAQRPDGSFPGHTYSGRPARDFYHADFATPIRRLEKLHPGAVRAEHRQALARYAEYFVRERTHGARPESEPTLYDVFDQNETGQEYMSRYLFASDRADEWGAFRVSGVDATTYAALLFVYLAERNPAEPRWRNLANMAIAGLAERCWDPESAFFSDVSTDGRRSPMRPGTGMYPFLLPEALGAREALDRWLLDEREFWLPAGFPATAKSDPTFRPDAEWKERRHNCPWNGRSWPMANSHLVEALATAARRRFPDLLPRAGEALQKAVRLLFHEADPSRPNCFEHYNPVTGVPALYRGYDDYMHSWVLDLVLREAVGIRESGGVEPLPMGVAFECDQLPPGLGIERVSSDGRRVDVVRRG
ncbi:MAG: hypothetical protein KIS66_09850 [Fimbriimonadaceae bacterium]|nr:hypothetical protein [Fimbriimonadaceae bacterium]